MDKKRLRISLYFDDELKDLEYIILGTVNKKSLVGMFLRNFLLFALRTKGKEETERIVYEIAKGNVTVLKELFSSNTSTDISLKEEKNLLTNEDTDFSVDVSKFIL